MGIKETKIWNGLNVCILITNGYDSDTYDRALFDFQYIDEDNDLLLYIAEEEDGTFTHTMTPCKRCTVNIKAIASMYDCMVEEDGTVSFNLPYSVYDDMVKYDELSKESVSDDNLLKMTSLHTVVTLPIATINGEPFYMYKTISSKSEGNTYTIRSVVVDKEFNNAMLYVEVTKYTGDELVNIHPVTRYAMAYPSAHIDKWVSISSIKELDEFIMSVNNNGQLYRLN